MTLGVKVQSYYLVIYWFDSNTLLYSPHSVVGLLSKLIKDVAYFQYVSFWLSPCSHWRPDNWILVWIYLNLCFFLNPRKDYGLFFKRSSELCIGILFQGGVTTLETYYFNCSYSCLWFREKNHIYFMCMIKDIFILL